MKRFRLLRADEIECRINTITKKGLTLLLYKTARTDADVLDETVGADRWENDFKLIDGVLFGGLGVDYGNGMVWKWDAGTESNTEAEKGRASDAFKRAGFKHGIGRELYSAPFIFIPAAECNIYEGKNGRLCCNDRFTVDQIGYGKDEKINALKITLKRKTVFEMGKIEPEPENAPETNQIIICADCGREVVDSGKSGEIWKAEDIAQYTQKRFGKLLCAECARRAYKESK